MAKQVQSDNRKAYVTSRNGDLSSENEVRLLHEAAEPRGPCLPSETVFRSRSGEHRDEAISVTPTITTDDIDYVKRLAAEPKKLSAVTEE